jgi:transposase-like protein
MENNQINYMPKKGVHVPKDVKEYVLRRVRESGKSVAEIAKEHGISKSRIHIWLKDETSGDSADPQFLRLKKENQLLKQLVAELSLKIRGDEKKGW